MVQATEIWVDRGNLRRSKVVRRELGGLEQGGILVAIDKFALTANNVSYAVSGDSIGYWRFFPAEGEWGKVTVWGMADVIASECPEIAVGERLYGFFPMASHLSLQPGRIRPGSFVDLAPHRQSLPGAYNQYSRTAAESEALRSIENERCLLFPLFITSFVLDDYLDSNGYFGAGQILIGSVSSKTGLGLAAYLRHNGRFKGRILGLTAEANRAFVASLGVCDQIVTYGQEASIDAQIPSVFVDMAGDGGLTRTLHQALGERMVRSISVGATHWEQRRAGKDLPGARPEFFFAPTQIEKRNADWGPGVLLQRAYAAGADLAAKVAGSMTIERITDTDAACRIWTDLLDNRVAPSRGIIVSLDGA